MSVTTTPRRPLKTIRPPSGFAALDLSELVAYRDLLRTLAVRDVRLRYRQTALGVIWVLIQPLMAAGIFSFVFGTIAGMTGLPGVPFFLFSFAGQVAWMCYSGTLTKASGSLVGNTQLVSKVYFPRLVLPLSTIGSTFIDFAVSLVVLVPLMLIFRVAPGWPLLTFPLWIMAIILFAVGGGLIASSLMVRYRDVAYILPVVTNMLVFLSPVGWSLLELSKKVPEAYHGVYYLVNPLAILIEGFRWSLFGHGMESFPVAVGWVAYAALATVAMLLAGAVVFRNLERSFSDVI